MTAWLPISIRSTTGEWIAVRVLVDTGASFSFMSTAYARQKKLPVPSATSHAALLTAAGPKASVVRDADFTIRFPRMPELSFDLLWLLRDDLPLDAPALLGLHNTVDLLNILFDGAPRPDGLMGCMEFAARSA
jgi:hypothetical protein